jgi:hypothetical protein
VPILETAAVGGYSSGMDARGRASPPTLEAAMIPPWMIEELEEEERRKESERETLRLPVSEIARNDDEGRSQEEPQERGVSILDISPSSECVLKI